MPQDGRYVDEQGHVFSLSKSEAEARGFRSLRRPRVVQAETETETGTEPETKMVEPAENKAVQRAPSTKRRRR